MPNESDATQAQALATALSLSATEFVSLSSKPPVASELLGFDGRTCFTSSPSTTYRYTLSLKNEKLCIWFEDCDSKQQCANDLSLEEYVDLKNNIPDASAPDYVEYFHKLLGKDASDGSEIPRTFGRTKDDTFRLEITMEFQVLARTHVAMYSFVMEPVAVERIDVLESRMRDLQETLQALRLNGNRGQTVHDVQRKANWGAELVDREQLVSDLRDESTSLWKEKPCPVVIQAEATKRIGSTVIWDQVGSGDNVNGVDGVISCLTPGVYQGTAMLNCPESTSSNSIWLSKGVKRIQMARGRSNLITTLVCVTRVDEGDELSVECNFNLSETSYLSLLYLGA